MNRKCMAPEASMKAALLIDDRGRRFLIPSGDGLTAVRGLGVVDRDAVSHAKWGETVSIAERKFTLFPATLSDLLSSLKRGPQIIVEKDASLISHYLSLRSGSRVLEFGAGSGSLTVCMLWHVAPEGFVITVDPNYKSLEISAENVAASGLMECWMPVIGSGFSFCTSAFADAAVMDVPEPWKCLTNAKAALREGGMLASYSPTVNQTETTVTSAEELGLIHELTFEVLFRKLEVAKGRTRHAFEMLGHSGYISVFRKGT